MQVDAWDPAYVSDDGVTQSKAKVDAGIEVPLAEWGPRDPADTSLPSSVLLVDGVRRLDAHLWLTPDDNGEARPGICASYAAGVVRCSTAGGAKVVASRVMHGLFTSAKDAPSLRAYPTAVYTAHRVGDGETGDLVNAVQQHLRALEIAVTDQAEVQDDELLIVDGPLHGRAHVPRALGYIKSHRVQYLTAELIRVVNALKAGQRTPVFALDTSWERYSWYLRLPGADVPAAGLVRLEASMDLTLDQVTTLADNAARVLPRLASSPYKDPRAPQNLTPIAGLEKRLRTLLGDQRLLQRGLRAAARLTRY
ncbi:DNA double-strand break repair nuclease NurA [Phytomonospora endophytica]|uniref:DNA double-strand break repair nuclease NurA n=1 Tax=Phytomonospora endophytica TaxID=714109 RepID=UPI003571335E